MPTNTQEPIQVKTAFVNLRRQRVLFNETFVDKGTSMPIRVNTTDKHTLLQQVNSFTAEEQAATILGWRAPLYGLNYQG